MCPSVGIDPMTCCTSSRCSTVELHPSCPYCRAKIVLKILAIIFLMIIIIFLMIIIIIIIIIIIMMMVMMMMIIIIMMIMMIPILKLFLKQNPPPCPPPPESVPAEDHQILIKEIDPCSTGLKYHQEKTLLKSVGVTTVEVMESPDTPVPNKQLTIGFPALSKKSKYTNSFLIGCSLPNSMGQRSRCTK